MDPTKLRAEFRRRAGRELRISDAKLNELIEEYRSRRDGYPQLRWSNDALDYPGGIELGEEEAAEARSIAEKRAARTGHPSAGPARPVGVLPWIEEAKAAIPLDPRGDRPEYDRPDLSVVPDPDGAPTYSRPAGL